MRATDGPPTQKIVKIRQLRFHPKSRPVDLSNCIVAERALAAWLANPGRRADICPVRTVWRAPKRNRAGEWH
jgi:hypothetical protein